MKNEKNIINGWLNVCKEEGYSSNHVIRELKKKFNVKKIGHYGTLDPLASGVLPVALGEATKTINFINYDHKAYSFIINWGKETDTCDSEGKVIEETDKRPTKLGINTAIKKYFTGKVSQQPPLFSAIKIDGQRAYDLARKNIKFEIKSRNIVIFKFKLLETKSRNNSKFYMSCGPGTYIRSIARDLARKLGSLGYASNIIRLENSHFDISNAIKFEKLMQLNEKDLKSILLPIDFVLSNIGEIKLEKKYSDMLKDGKVVLMNKYNNEDFNNNFFKIKNNTKLISIANLKKGYNIPRRNFNN